VAKSAGQVSSGKEPPAAGDIVAVGGGMGWLNRVGGEGPGSGCRRRRRRAAVRGTGGKVARSRALDLDRTAMGGSGRGGASGEAMARIAVGLARQLAPGSRSQPRACDSGDRTYEPALL
jgi:hypothetical protein